MSQALRVLIVYEHLPHYRLGVFQELDRDPELEIHFAAGATSYHGDIPTIPEGALKHRVNLSNVWLGPLLWQSHLISHVLRHRYDAVVFLGSFRYLSTWVTAAIARIKRTRTLMWTIGWHRPDSRFKAIVRNLFYRLAHALLLYGESGRAIGTAQGYPRNRMHVIGNSHDVHSPDTQDAIPAPRLKELIPVGEVVGAVIRLTPAKRLDLLIRAVAVLRATGRRISVVLAGGGPEQASLQNLASSLGVPLLVTGPVYSPDGLSQIYSALNLTVVPEAAGLTVIQSLLNGVPVISVDAPYRQMPEYEAIKPGVTGDLYKPDDVDDLAQVVENWLVKVQENRGRIASDCKGYVTTHWSSASHAARIKTVLKEDRTA